MLSRRRRCGWAPLLVLWAVPTLAAPPQRPAVDEKAMREAMSKAEEQEVFPSAASYSHFLRARLAHDNGDHQGALDELRLALASDDTNPFLMTELAEELARLSELGRAEYELKQVVQRYPKYEPAHLLLGRVLYEANKPLGARAHLLRAISLKPKKAEAYLVLTQVFLDQGSIEEAIGVVEKLGAAVPGDPVGYRRLGLALSERGEERAEGLLRHAVERDPGDLESWTALARLHDSLGHEAKALQVLEEALIQDAENKDLLLEAGRLALRLEQLPVARGYFDRVLSLGSDPEVAVKVAFGYLSTRNLDEAARVLDAARAVGSEPRLHFYAGLVHERRKAFGSALAAFEALPREVGELYFEGRLHRAQALSSLLRHTPALRAFQELFRERPSMPGLETSWARALERSGKVREAEERFVRCLSRSSAEDVLDALSGFYQRQHRLGDLIALFLRTLAERPADEALRFAMAVTQDRNGDWQEAIAQMRLVLSANPNNAAALNFIAYTLAERGGDLDEAEQLVRQALGLRPQSPAFLDSLAWVLLKKGQASRALEYLEKAVSSAPYEPALLEHLGEAASQVGQVLRAQQAYRRALDLLRSDPEMAERPDQQREIEAKLKMLTLERTAR